MGKAKYKYKIKDVIKFNKYKEQGNIHNAFGEGLIIERHVHSMTEPIGEIFYLIHLKNEQGTTVVVNESWIIDVQNN